MQTQLNMSNTCEYMYVGLFMYECQVHGNVQVETQISLKSHTSPEELAHRAKLCTRCSTSENSEGEGCYSVLRLAPSVSGSITSSKLSSTFESRAQTDSHLF
jgi:hypothetical protein